MVRIRLRRQGAKKKPTYRIVVADSRAPRDGRYIENIGFYDPRTDPPTVKIKADRALYWLGVGAQPSDPVLRLLKKTGIWQQFKRIEVPPEAEAEVAEEGMAEPLAAEEVIEAEAVEKEAAEPQAAEAPEAAEVEAEGEISEEPEAAEVEAGEEALKEA